MRFSVLYIHQFVQNVLIFLLLFCFILCIYPPWCSLSFLVLCSVVCPLIWKIIVIIFSPISSALVYLFSSGIPIIACVRTFEVVPQLFQTFFFTLCVCVLAHTHAVWFLLNYLHIHWSFIQLYLVFLWGHLEHSSSLLLCCWFLAFSLDSYSFHLFTEIAHQILHFIYLFQNF